MTYSRVSFSDKTQEHQLDLNRLPLDTLQVNIGKRCNQACHHCHVEAGPKRTENMELATIDRLLTLIRASQENTSGIKFVDITGGAPELNPHFRYFVEKIRGMNIDVIDRCNLTVFFEQNQKDTPDFLAHHQVQITASMPCYSRNNVEKQRGNGVFDKSIKALQQLNNLGYGKQNSGLILNLVYNPVGSFLPPAQKQLEADYKRELKNLFNIEFNHLYTITNMPIKRFLNDLKRENRLESYMHTLLENFNPNAAKGIMCRNLISVGWDGALYDCDFNQMLEIPIARNSKSIFQIESFDEFYSQPIAFENHCFGCTAGNGSSCGGSLI